MAETAAGRTTRVVGGGACDHVTVVGGVRGIGGKPRCC